MKLAGEQLVLDTNILVHLLRGKKAAEMIEHAYGVSGRSPRAPISVVTKGEIGGVLLTTDGDFMHLDVAGVRVERVLDSQLR